MMPWKLSLHLFFNIHITPTDDITIQIHKNIVDNENIIFMIYILGFACVSITAPLSGDTTY